MNRKLFNGLLLLMVATGGVGTFTSCKDTEQDFRNDVLVGQQDLSDKIAAIRNLTDDIFRTNLDNEINRLIDLGDFATAAELAKVAAAVEAANSRIDTLKEELENADKANKEEIDKLNERLETVIADLAKAVEDCNAYTDSKFNELKEQLDKVEATANDANELAQLNAEKIEKLDERLTDIEERVGVLEGDVKELKDKVDDLYTLYADLLDHINSLAGTVAEIQEDVKELNDKVANLFTNLERLVTGLIVEQTYNPVFGTLNLPFGVQSNMLINYYYQSAEDVTFPVGNPSHEYSTNGEVFGSVSTKLPIASPETYAANTQKLESLGNLYMTINPIQRSFDGLDFELVKSNGEAIPGKFVAEASDDVLSFGYTRADSSPNGFYKAKIVTDSDEKLIKAIKVDVEDGLKDAFKDAVKNHTRQDFVELAKLLYKQFDGVLPAYAAKVSWNALDAEGKEVKKSVLSGYDLAVTTFRPLSYSTGFGFGVDKQLPTFGSLQSVINQLFDDIKDSFKLELEGVDGLDDVTITIDNLEFKIEPTTITIEIGPIDILDESGLPTGTKTEKVSIQLGYDGGEVSIPGDNDTALNDLIAQIQKAVEDMISGDDGLIAQINQQIKEKIVGQVNDMIIEINKQLESVNTQIYESIEKIQEKINAQLNGALGAAQNLIDLYNRFAEKINDIIKNPNAYLQVVMGYEGVDGNLHHLSTVESDPTYVSSGAIQLFMTSYNAEIIVPSYKKYVAITKADPKDDLVKLNADVNGEKNGLNQVLSGNQQILAFDASKLTPGVTYEIFYQSLDFHGYTSTRKYYIRVK